MSEQAAPRDDNYTLRLAHYWLNGGYPKQALDILRNALHATGEKMADKMLYPNEGIAALLTERDKATIERCAKNQRTPGTKEVCEMCAVEYGDAMTVAPEGSKYACAQKSCPIRKGA